MNRTATRKIPLGKISIGGSPKVLVQSMCNIKTSRVEEVSAQIKRCQALGADLMRVSVLDKEDALALPELVKKVDIPLVADIHFDYRLALTAIESGIAAIRINPGNIGGMDRVALVAEAAKAHHTAIRVGVNAGSLDASLAEHPSAEALLLSAKKHVGMLESCDFHDIVISLKASDVLLTIEAYRKASEAFPYPLHLGVTEAGPKDIGLLRSAAALSPLLLEGIGDTIRISISEEPEEEIKAANRLLHDLGLKEDYFTFVSCPTCGRTEVDLVPLAKKVLGYLEDHPKKIKVAVMGCIVNGPGEAKEADVGIAGGRGSYVLFKKGQVTKTIKEAEAYDCLIEEIEKL